jgi:RNA polymerase sigma factor (sigma-70 family)
MTQELKTPELTGATTLLSTSLSVATDEDPVTDVERAFLTLLFNKYRGSLYRYLTTFVSSPEDASDLLQESYFRLLRHSNLIKVEEMARSYLFEIARNLARDHLRRSKSHHVTNHVPLDEYDLESDECGPDHQIALEQMVAALSVAVSELPQPARTIFLLSRFRAMTYEEIGRTLGIGTRSVERRMAEALDDLAAHIGIER